MGVFAPDGVACACGRASRVLATIEGRHEDAVLTPEGLAVRRVDYIFKGAEHLREAQVVQRERGAIVVRVVPAPGWGAADEAALRARVAEWISPRLSVLIERVEFIPREAGKFRAVRSELPP